MLRSNHQQRNNLTNKFSNLIGILPFMRREQRAFRSPAHADSVNWAQTSWGQKFIKSTTLMLALFCTASIALADVKITTRSSANGQSTSYTTYIKGARQRTEGMGYTTIYQCDLKRMIQINDKTRSYLITPLEGADKSGGSNPQSRSGKARKGGVLTYHTINTDTGERKQMNGMTAKHIKSKMVMTASEGACNTMNMEMETDGWYAEIPGGPSCPTDAASSFPMDQSDCLDEVRFKTEGPANIGQPMTTTTRIKFNMGGDSAGVDIPASSSTQEVTDISTTKLDQSLFEIPAGYKEVKSTQELGSPY